MSSNIDFENDFPASTSVAEAMDSFREAHDTEYGILRHIRGKGDRPANYHYYPANCLRPNIPYYDVSDIDKYSTYAAWRTLTDAASAGFDANEDVTSAGMYFFACATYGKNRYFAVMFDRSGDMATGTLFQELGKGIWEHNPWIMIIDEYGEDMEMMAGKATKISLEYRPVSESLIPYGIIGAYLAQRDQSALQLLSESKTTEPVWKIHFQCPSFIEQSERDPIIENPRQQNVIYPACWHSQKEEFQLPGV